MTLIIAFYITKLAFPLALRHYKHLYLKRTSILDWTTGPNGTCSTKTMSFKILTDYRLQKCLDLNMLRMSR